MLNPDMEGDLASVAPSEALEGGTNHRAPGPVVEYGSWLSGNVLLLLGRFPAGGAVALALNQGECSRNLPVKEYPLVNPVTVSPEQAVRKVLLASFPPAAEADRQRGDLVVRTGNGSCTLGPDDRARLFVDLPRLILDGLGEADYAVRPGLLDFLSSALGMETQSPGAELSRNLLFIRDQVREALPPCQVVKEQPQGMNVETLVGVDERSFYVRGWVWDGEGTVTSLTAVSPEGARAELLDKAFFHHRPDVEGGFAPMAKRHTTAPAGFCCYFQLPQPSYQPLGWVLEMGNSLGMRKQAPAPEVQRDPSEARNFVVQDLIYEELPRDEFRARHAFPALRRVQQRLAEEVAVVRVKQFGTPPANATVSVIVPLYQRIQLLEHQLAQFVSDPQMAEADLVYVLDSPEQTAALAEAAEKLHRLYRVPFRVVFLNRNGGIAAATNLGVSQARADLLVLLHSDTLPDRPGWLGTLSSVYRANPLLGALGPKLLFEDDAVEQAGLRVLFHEHLEEWDLRPVYRGLSRKLPITNVARQVPAVSGACLMVARGLFERVGGLNTTYVQGGYEDYELCLRLLEAGRENWYSPQVELFHLERQSYRGEQRAILNRYNRWLFNYHWKARLAALARGTSPTAG